MEISRILIISAIIGFVYANDIILTEADLEQRLSTYFNKWKNDDIDSLLSVKQLETVEVPNIEGNYKTTGVTVQYSMSGMKLSGLHNITLESIQILGSKRQIMVSVSTPALMLVADNYYLKGRAYYFYSFKGSGKMRLNLETVTLSLNIYFNITESNLVVDDLDIEFTIAHLEADLENSSWPINHILNKEGLSIIANHQNEIVSKARDYLVPLSNHYLELITTEELLSLVSRNQ